MTTEHPCPLADEHIVMTSAGWPDLGKVNYRDPAKYSYGSCAVCGVPAHVPHSPSSAHLRARQQAWEGGRRAWPEGRRGGA